MKLNNSIKNFNQGIGKVITPQQTCKIVLKKLLEGDHPIMERYFKVQKPSNIPQYRVIATEYCQQITRAQGTNGKGHFDEQALASGLMELAERYSCFKYLRSKDNYKTASFKDFKSNLFQIENFYANFVNAPYVRMLNDSELINAKIRWYKGYTLSGKEAHLPMYLLYFILEGTNGMAAGNSLEEALLHGICEVIERHCLTQIELNRLTTPLIDPASIDSLIAKELIKKFSFLKQQVFIKDFSLGIGLPVIGVIRKINKNDCFITAGVATSREEALIRALTENSQCADKRWTFYKKMHLAKHYLKNDKAIPMKSIVNIENKNIKIELQAIQGILDKQGMKAFFLDATDRILGIPSVFVYIAGAKYFDEEVSCRNILISLVNECLVSKDYGGASRYIDMGESIDKEHIYLYFYYRGEIFMQKKNYPEAISCFRKVVDKLKIDEVKKIALFNLGICYHAIKDMDNAIDYYVKTIDLFPDFSFEYFKLAEANAFPGDKNLFGDSEISYEEIKSFRISFPAVNLKEFKGLLSRYKKDKKAILAYLEKVKKYISLRQYNKALTEGDKIIKLNSLAAKAINLDKLLYICYEKTKNYKKAINGLRELEKIDKENCLINFAISRCCRKIHELDKADQEFSIGMRKLGGRFKCEGCPNRLV